MIIVYLKVMLYIAVTRFSEETFNENYDVYLKTTTQVVAKLYDVLNEIS